MAAELRGGQQRGLFDNPVISFSTEELAQTARLLDALHPGLSPAQLAGAVLDELAIKPTRRAREVVAEAIRLARLGSRPGLGDVTPTAWQASTDEVRAWAREARYHLEDTGPVPAAVIAAYNQAHPDRPY